MKIHIFYRHFNVLGSDFRGRPKWFSFEKSFTNLLQSITNKNVKLHVVMDGDINSNFVGKYKNQYTLHNIKANNDQSSFRQTWEIAKNTQIGDNDLIYFVENDYMHMNNWVDKVIDLFSTYKLPHYVSLYDHPDKYFAPQYEDLVSKVINTETHYWRTTPSTCGSFIVNKQLFDLDYDIHTTVPGDHNKWTQLSEERNRLVITPIPGLSTHCIEGFLSPTIDWSKL